MKSQPSRLGYLAAMLGLSAGIGINPALDAPASRSGYRRPGPGKRNRGPYTRNRLSRGMNPRKRKRMMRRRIEKQVQEEVERLMPSTFRIAVAIEPPPWPNGRPVVLGTVGVYGPGRIREVAGVHFYDVLGHHQFEIRFRTATTAEINDSLSQWLQEDAFRDEELTDYWQDRRNAA